MKKHVLLVLAMASCVAFAPPAMSQSTLKVDEDSPVRRIKIIGEDGGMFYTVDCKNRQRGSVTVTGNPAQTCATRKHGDGKKQCRAAWLIESAAEFVCR